MNLTGKNELLRNKTDSIARKTWKTEKILKQILQMNFNPHNAQDTAKIQTLPGHNNHANMFYGLY